MLSEKLTLVHQNCSVYPDQCDFIVVVLDVIDNSVMILELFTPRTINIMITILASTLMDDNFMFTICEHCSFVIFLFKCSSLLK